jgi:hypothetical protein
MQTEVAALRDLFKTELKTQVKPIAADQATAKKQNEKIGEILNKQGRTTAELSEQLMKLSRSVETRFDKLQQELHDSVKADLKEYFKHSDNVMQQAVAGLRNTMMEILSMQNTLVVDEPMITTARSKKRFANLSQTFLGNPSTSAQSFSQPYYTPPY